MASVPGMPDMASLSPEERRAYEMLQQRQVREPGGCAAHGQNSRAGSNRMFIEKGRIWGAGVSQAGEKEKEDVCARDGHAQACEKRLLGAAAFLDDRSPGARIVSRRAQ